MNSVQLIGRLTRDPDAEQTAGGTPVTTFRLAIDRLGRKGADFVTVKTWDRVAEATAEHLTRGRRVAVQGRLAHEEWVGSDGRRAERLTVVADRVEFLDAPAARTWPAAHHPWLGASRVIPAHPSPVVMRQAQVPRWLADRLASLDRPVLIDAGRVDGAVEQFDLLSAADSVWVLVDPIVEQVIAARAVAEWLNKTGPLELLVREPGDEPARDSASALSATLGWPVAATVPDDRQAARALCGLSPGGRRRGGRAAPAGRPSRRGRARPAQPGSGRRSGDGRDPPAADGRRDGTADRPCTRGAHGSLDDRPARRRGAGVARAAAARSCCSGVKVHAGTVERSADGRREPIRTASFFQHRLPEPPGASRR
jgi:single-strand DNA-binding protein